jgi:hypothetical protein
MKPQKAALGTDEEEEEEEHRKKRLSLPLSLSLTHWPSIKEKV